MTKKNHVLEKVKNTSISRLYVALVALEKMEKMDKAKAKEIGFRLEIDETTGERTYNYEAT